ncbi:MAG: hypothetical protein Q9195_000253 [Heterodermia aff. obscurata]
MRIIKVGNLQQEDIPYSLISEYIWSQIEPATAILCACMVTYRPLFTTSILPSFASKLFRTAGRGKSDSITNSDSTVSNSSSEQTMVWPVARDLLGRDLQPGHDLYSKAGKGALHVVNVGHIARSLAERQDERDGTKDPGVINVRQSVEISTV